ncbi:MAG: DNA cytosine methyltransferase [Chloroflexi bacterium]|nr:DNA cytosine methyltransferase [Chloroflexota bacterium]
MASVVDVFCGAGGLTHGFVRQGFNVVAGIDVDAACKYPYENNNNGSVFIHRSIRDIEAHEINTLFVPNQPKILVGCAPCQQYSSYTRKRKSEDKWDLVIGFAELILEVKPDVFSMENVPALVTYQDGSVFREFIEMLEPHYGHDIWWQVVYAPNYGVPQRRKRLVVLGSRLGRIELLERAREPSDYATVDDAIGTLSPLAAGEVCEHDPLHRSQGLSQLNLERIRQSIPGGSWRDWDESLLAPCHRKASGQSYGSVYGRMKHDCPSPTITTQAYGFGTGRFGHPRQDRALSLREMALLQTFPEDYEFVDFENSVCSFNRVGKLIGNAVPVLLAEYIAQSIERHLEEHGQSK